jgi:hypothetical protein
LARLNPISAVLLISASQNMPAFKDLRPNSLFMKTGNFFRPNRENFGRIRDKTLWPWPLWPSRISSQRSSYYQPANTGDGTKRGCRGIDLIVVCAVRKRAQFLNEGIVPLGLDQLDIAMLALCCERISAVYLAAFFPFGRNAIALQQPYQMVCLKAAGTPRILGDADPT